MKRKCLKIIMSLAIIVDSDENLVFRMGADGKPFITDMEKALSAQIGQDEAS